MMIAKDQSGSKPSVGGFILILVLSDLALIIPLVCLVCNWLTEIWFEWRVKIDTSFELISKPWKMKIDFNQFCGPSAICSFCEGRALLYHQRRSFYGCERSLCRLAKVTAPPALTVGKGQEGAEWLKWSLQMVLPQNGPNGVGTKM